MKTHQPLFISAIIPVVMIALVSLSFRNSKTDLASAIQSGVVHVNIHGDGNYTHYTKPIAVEITNTSRSAQEISIPVGSWFSSEDPGIQDIISIQEELIALNPGETKKVNINGMCIQHQNAAPKDESVFQYHKSAQPELVQFAKYLSTNNYQGIAAQQLMWNVADQSDPAMQYDGTEQNLAAINYIRKNMKLPDYQPDAEPEVTAIRRRSGSFRGMFQVEFSHAHNTHIALFNEQNIVLQEILPEQSIRGKKKVEYSFDPIAYEGQTLYARLIVDGQIEMERVIEL